MGYDGERDVLALGVGLLFDIAQIHAFTQGNKRTALAAADAFMIANGYILMIADGEKLYQLVIDATTGAIGAADAIRILEPYLCPVD